MEESKRGEHRSSRRSFLKGVTAASVVALDTAAKPAIPAKDAAVSIDEQQRGPGRRFIAIQVGGVSFVDEGVDPVLDNLQRAQVNALMLAVFTYGRGIAGRQVPGQPLPDHGAQKYDTDTFHGGSYAAVHPEYYTGTSLKDFRAPDLGEFDILGAVIPKAKARGMQSYCWLEDVYNPRFLAGFERLSEIDVYGRRTNQACLNHPEVRSFLRSLVEDYIKTYEVDGLMWGSERQGPLNNAIGSRHGGFNGRATLTCFCNHCRAVGRERGIDVERARTGLIELDKFARAGSANQKPSDGYFVTFWRILLNYPEILAWEKLWTDGQQEIYGEIYGTAKGINNRVQVGWHIWHNNSFSPFFRAEQDYAKLRQVSDYLKVVMYNNCGGPRLHQYVSNMHSTIFRDISAEETLAFHYGVLGYGDEARLEALSTSGLSADYVARETRRAVSGVHNEIPIYPGIDIDIPTESREKKTQPSDVKSAVRAAFSAGAAGVVLSRKYSEMRLANLSAAGEAIRELGPS
jgi:hypothetical protein